MIRFALFVFDLNDLKLINDTYGHETGDQYILKSCELVKKYFPGNIVYRFGGDEFIVYITGDKYEERFNCLEQFNKAIEDWDVLKNIDDGGAEIDGHAPIAADERHEVQVGGYRRVAVV